MLKDILRRYPPLWRVARRLAGWLPGSGTSAGYAPLDARSSAGEAARLAEAWKDQTIPERQRALVDQELAAYRRGEVNANFDALVDAVRPYTATTTHRLSVLEVGCSSGYYAQVLRLRDQDTAYTGCDFSPGFIELARRCHPEYPFDVQDATALGYASGSFDIVVSGCCILHIPNYREAIAQAARVARRVVVFHRTPVHHRLPTRSFSKLAYGVRTVEIHFNEQELVECFRTCGLRIVGITTIATDWRDGDAFAVKTYACEKTT